MSVVSTEDQARRLRRQFALLAAATLTGSVLCFCLARNSAAARAELEHRRAALAQATRDAQAVLQLRQTPIPWAASLPRGGDLLADLSRAMQTVSIAPDVLVASAPQPPRRRPGSALLELSHRLIFEPLTLETVVRCCQALIEARADLIVSGVQLRAEPSTPSWSAEITVTEVRVETRLEP